MIDQELKVPSIEAIKTEVATYEINGHPWEITDKCAKALQDKIIDGFHSYVVDLIRDELMECDLEEDED